MQRKQAKLNHKQIICRMAHTPFTARRLICQRYSDNPTYTEGHYQMRGADQTFGMRDY